MQILVDGADRVPAGMTTVVSIGAYDGIHRGHQLVLKSVVQLANERGCASGVVTFDRHPASITRPENAPLLLTDHNQRMELFEALGLDYVYLVEFTQERAQTTEFDFAADVLVDRMSVVAVVVGEDFHFGKGRTGSVESLTEIGSNFGFEVVGLELLGSNLRVPGLAEPVSSTAVRRSLLGGDIARVNELLGRKFEIRGTVSQGDKRGRMIGFPTANIAARPGWAWPANGVYACWAVLPDGSRLPAAVNVGLRPTFHQRAEQPVLEVHVLDFSGDLYGQQLRVEFVAFLRSEQRFGGIDELREQLAIDVGDTLRVLGLGAS